MIINLTDAAALDRAVVGSKAANLAAAAARGLPVPPGFVVPVGAEPEAADVLAATTRLGGGPMAVRSSALAEDLAEASYAGLYETYLNVSPTDVSTAIRSCRDSGNTARVSAYRPRISATGVAVLVQPMVPASAAGVAFTANPVTGARNEVVVNAVAGLGASLVAGETVGEQWVIRGRNAHPTRHDGVLTPEQALAVADLARSVAEQSGRPQDIEWAIGEGHLHLLQARPMTALPEPVTWPAPERGLWVSNLRIGEWLPDPVTPLFGDWLLPRLDEGLRHGMCETIGAAVSFPCALVNGWYYTRPNPSPSDLPGAIVGSHGRLVPFMLNALIRPGRDPKGAADALLDALYDRWRHEVIPHYRALAATDPSGLPHTDLIGLVDEITRTAGRCLWYLAVVGGAAWKMENALHRYLARHRLGHVEVQKLLLGLDARDGQPPGHAVYSLDWFHATAAETTHVPHGPRQDHHGELRTRRLQTEQACRAGLAHDPGLLHRWQAMLTTTQRYARIREEQASELTRGWPLLRSCAHLLGQTLTASGVIDEPEELFFLNRTELTHNRPLGSAARQRRALWQRQRRLVPPLAIGTGPPLIGHHLERILGITRANTHDDAFLIGQPASPGRATGPARIVRDPDDFDRVQPGDVLVARATAPAWTPLFTRVVAVVTDAGTLAAHASLIAREYGIPAVVATGNATDTVSDGQRLTVDGGRGSVTLGGP